jgi:hypothetical protein
MPADLASLGLGGITDLAHLACKTGIRHLAITSWPQAAILLAGCGGSRVNRSKQRHLDVTRTECPE